jgi:WD40 repeat protein
MPESVRALRVKTLGFAFLVVIVVSSTARAQAPPRHPKSFPQLQFESTSLNKITKAFPSADGKFLITVNVPFVSLWDIQRALLLKTVQITDEYSDIFPVSPNGRFLLISKEEGHIQDRDGRATTVCWDLFAGRKLWEHMTTAPVTAIAFTDDSKIVAVGSGQGDPRVNKFTIDFLDSERGTDVHRALNIDVNKYKDVDPFEYTNIVGDTHFEAIDAKLEFSDDHAFLAAAVAGESISVWKIGSTEPLIQIPTTSLTFAISPHGNAVAFVDNNGGRPQIVIRDVQKKNAPVQFELSAATNYTVVYKPESPLPIVLGSLDQQGWPLDGDLTSAKGFSVSTFTSTSTTHVISDSDKYLGYMGDSVWTMRIAGCVEALSCLTLTRISLKGEKSESIFQTKDPARGEVQFTDGDKKLFVNLPGAAESWNLTTGKVDRLNDKPPIDESDSLDDFSSPQEFPRWIGDDGHVMRAACVVQGDKTSPQSTLEITDLSDSQLKVSVPDCNHPVARRGRMVFWCNSGGWLQVAMLGESSSKSLVPFSCVGDGQWDPVISDDGSMVAATAGGDLSALSITNNTEAQKVFHSDLDNLGVVALDATGKYLLALDQAKKIVYDEGQGTEFGVACFHFDPLTHAFKLAWKSDEGGSSISVAKKLGIVVVSAGNVLKILSLRSGKTITSLRPSEFDVRSVTFSADNAMMAVTLGDEEVQLWKTRAWRRLARLVSFDDTEDWLVVNDQGYFDGTPLAWRTVLWRFSDRILDVYPVEVGFKNFFVPGLLSDLINDPSKLAAGDIRSLDRRQPRVEIKLNESNKSSVLPSGLVSLRVTVTEARIDSQHPGKGSGARDLRLFRNGSLVHFWHGDFELNQDGAVEFSQDVRITSGKNVFTAYAFSHTDIKSSQGPLSALEIVGDAAIRRKGEVFIVTVGINQYHDPDHFPTLTYAVPDAQDFGQAIKISEDKTGDYAPAHVIPILDGDATKDTIAGVLARFSGARSGSLLLPESKQEISLPILQPEDTLYFFFAGHGTAIGKRFYLITHDTEYKHGLNGPGSGRITQGISDMDLDSLYEPIDGSRFVIIIDACNSGQVLEADEKRRAPMNSTGLAQLAYEKGIDVLTASQNYGVASESTDLGHGLLTYALVSEGLSQARLKSQSLGTTISLFDWFSYAIDRVPSLAAGHIRSLYTVGANDELFQLPRAFYRSESEARLFRLAALDQDGAVPGNSQR